MNDRGHDTETGLTHIRVDAETISMSLPRLGAIPPRALKRVLELDGFSVAHEDDDNWTLARDGVEDVVLVPKLGPVIAEDVLLRVVMITPRRSPQYLFSGR